MAEENRRISTTPIPVPVLFGGSQSAAPTPSPLSQAPVAAVGEGDAPAAQTVAPAPVEATATEVGGGAAPTDVPTDGAADAPTDARAGAPAGASTDAPVEANSTDVAMTDAGGAEKAVSPAPTPAPATMTSAASPAPARTSTPLRTNGQEASSRAASQHPDTGFTMPAEAPPHGAPTRQYLNSKVTGAVLDGMKLVAKERPNDPLRVLGEFLLQRSREFESSQQDRVDRQDRHT